MLRATSKALKEVKTQENKMNFQPLESLLPNQESANRSLPNPTTAVKQENMQQAPKLSMEQRVGALDRFYRLPDGTSQRLESLAIIEEIKGIENDIKELKAEEALAMSIKKVNQVAETMKTHKTDRINKCKDSNKFNIQISGPRTCSKCKICENYLLRGKHWTSTTRSSMKPPTP